MHYLLLLPLLGIVLFFILPLSIAGPLYVVILIISGLMYWVIYRAMKKSHNSGIETFIGTEARVVSVIEPGEDARYLVKIRGETWRANSKDELQPGDRAKILSVAGLIMEINKITDKT